MGLGLEFGAWSLGFGGWVSLSSLGPTGFGGSANSSEGVGQPVTIP